MKQLLILISILFLTSCDTENASDCFQRTGTIVTVQVDVTEFKRILVNPNVQLILKEGETTAVTIETGDNLLNEVSAVVEGDRLVLKNENDCNFVRSFNQTKVYVTAPDITEIRSATQFDIASDGVLNYPSLTLLSEDFNESTGSTNGTFNLKVASEKVSIVSNSFASFFISGTVTDLSVSFFSGIGRFDGKDLITQNVQLFHRGTNKMIVNPQESIKGELRSTGDVISVNKPPLVEVEAFFSGRLKFQ